MIEDQQYVNNIVIFRVSTTFTTLKTSLWLNRQTYQKICERVRKGSYRRTTVINPSIWYWPSEVSRNGSYTRKPKLYSTSFRDMANLPGTRKPYLHVKVDPLTMLLWNLAQIISQQTSRSTDSFLSKHVTRCQRKLKSNPIPSLMAVSLESNTANEKL